MSDTPERPLSRGQRIVLCAAAVPMVAFGGMGGVGTYSNITSVFHRSATALGVVAAGEGATLVLALVLVGLTMLGQSAPAAVRIGLWTLPAVASLTGAAVAKTVTEAVVFAVTPMAMCVSAEGMGLLARRIVVYRTGVDAEAQRRNAAVMQRLAYHRARAANHPDEKARNGSELESWKLAKKVGAGDALLGANLVDVQRGRMTDGADAALAGMFGLPVTPVTPSAHGVTPAPAPHAVEGADEEGVTPPVTGVTPPVTDGGTQVTPELETVPSQPVTPVTPPEEPPVTLEEIAAVAGVPTPVVGEPLSDEQLVVVLRHLRYTDDPPLSYRQAVAAFREAGFVGGEQRIRRAWGSLMSHEESGA
ncbi:hypothetical protein [Streptomyces rapamycinicus]|uniref:Conjugal transfer protein n=2 Tax=Streptomyces rapamycinicus TaxID=1226757 RepID=A0A0A0NJL2_STRRN|nr:hypothetical protein [Streptomyces rapamycinicus]AGP57371.1 hypothetical protein M271_29630 [Streptomyces rapamycinicus NRRL 5491]MBB4785022.1 hypothetical protein [Streptomyces rapamycinicus]RLV79502.1 hypothetical protein D3C57_113995 [Streptomyces rapamycinicus NRRL 5491]UTO65255.1 hypothetical protein LJB45_24985 [Streptomyces rapamycinicus]UTP33211.1 hypothetical protein LIV37_30115 [Streptomyces rapamycinicus NRRL 5491]